VVDEEFLRKIPDLIERERVRGVLFLELTENGDCRFHRNRCSFYLYDDKGFSITVNSGTGALFGSRRIDNIDIVDFRYDGSNKIDLIGRDGKVKITYQKVSEGKN